MKYLFPFEKLKVWHSAKDLAVQVCKITKEFPPQERFSLVTQLNKSAVSVPSNIAEGCSRTSKKDQAHFTQIAYGSLMELVCQLIIAKELSYIKEKQLSDWRNMIEGIAKMLNALRKSQLSKT